MLEIKMWKYNEICDFFAIFYVTLLLLAIANEWRFEKLDCSVRLRSFSSHPPRR